MKYAAVALLVANAEAAQLSGCLKGLKAKVYSDSKCSKDAHAEIAALDTDLEQTGKCNPVKAEQKELDALASAEHNAELHVQVAKDAKKALERATSTDLHGKTPAEYYADEYPLVKAAWIKKTASAKYVADYKAANASEVAKVDTYIAAFTTWYDESKATAPNDLEGKKTAMDAAEKELATNVDVKQLQASVTDQKDYEKLVAEKIDSTEIGQVEAYIVLDVANDQAIQRTKDLQNAIDTQKKRIDRLTYATLMTCDAKAGVVIKAWTDAKCEGKAGFEVHAEWGKCTKTKEGEYVKFTGAAALKAAAVALVAFAGSQF